MEICQYDNVCAILVAFKKKHKTNEWHGKNSGAEWT